MSDPGGHSFGKAEPGAGSAERWREWEAYLFGIDLFNHGYYWEAHESWEAAWHVAGRRGPVADFLKGLIKLAAAGVKGREGRVAGVRRHATRARELIESAARASGDPDQMLGLPLAVLRENLARLIETPEQILSTTTAPVVVVMPFRLTVSDA